MTLPIITTFCSYSPILEYCLHTAKKHNPDARVILLGDEECVAEAKKHLHNVEVHLLEYDALALEMQEKYQHRSTLSEKFELFCILRWFCVRAFLEREQLDGCVHLDADTLLFSNVELEQKRLPDCDLALCKWDEVRNVGCTSFFNSRKVLDDFCRFTLDIYNSPERFEELSAQNQKSRGRYWVSDMSLLGAFEREADVRSIYLNELREGTYYDSQVSKEENFRGYWRCSISKRSVKRIYFRDGLPYGALKETGEKILFKAIHCHAFAKFAMPYFAACKEAPVRIAWLNFYLAFLSPKKFWERFGKYRISWGGRLRQLIRGSK